MSQNECRVRKASLILGAFAYINIICASFSYSQDVIELYFTEPKCGPYWLPSPIFNRDGSISRAKKENVYCKKTDQSSRVNSEISDKIQSLLLLDASDIYLSTYIFNDVRIANYICKIVKNGGNAKIILDQNITNSRALETVRECVEEKNIYIVGGMQTIRNAHSKILFIRNERHANIITSSGHFGRGETINFEHWVYQQYDSVDDYHYKKYRCFFESSIGISLGSKLEEEFQAFEACSKLVSRDLESFKSHRNFFLPFERIELQNAMQDMITNAESLDLSVMSFNSGDLLRSLQLALFSGSSVRIILDDDIYWSMKGSCKHCISEQSTMEDFVFPLMEAGADIRFLETNHHCPSNILHDKLMIAKNDKARASVILGSANFTEDGLGRFGFNQGNLEQVLFISDVQLANQASAHFERIWQLSTEYHNLPLNDEATNKYLTCM